MATTDRPPVPGTLSFNSEVLVTMPSGQETRGRLRSAVPGEAEVNGRKPEVLVTVGKLAMWVPRTSVRPVPPSRLTRARRWLSSFLFGEA